ncbi:unnamed protein product, partial [Adineta steineri]
VSGSEVGQTKQPHDDNVLKTINEDSNDSTQGMVIDEGEEQTLTNDEKPTKSIPSTTNFSTITSLVEKEISKTLNETEKRLSNNMNSSPERPINNINNNTNHNNSSTQAPPPPPPPSLPPPPPPLVTVNKPQSPGTHYQYPPHS